MEHVRSITTHLWKHPLMMTYMQALVTDINMQNGVALYPVYLLVNNSWFINQHRWILFLLKDNRSIDSLKL